MDTHSGHIPHLVMKGRSSTSRLSVPLLQEKQEKAGAASNKNGGGRSIVLREKVVGLWDFFVKKGIVTAGRKKGHTRAHRFVSIFRSQNGRIRISQRDDLEVCWRFFSLFLTSRKNKMFFFFRTYGLQTPSPWRFGLFLLNDFSQTLLLPAEGGSQRSKKWNNRCSAYNDDAKWVFTPRLSVFSSAYVCTVWEVRGIFLFCSSPSQVSSRHFFSSAFLHLRLLDGLFYESCLVFRAIH